MTHEEVLTHIDSAIEEVLSRSAILKQAKLYYGRYLQTDRPGLERQLCAELYMALHKQEHLGGAFVEFPGKTKIASQKGSDKQKPGNHVEKVDLAVEYADRWVYIEVKLDDAIDSSRDFQKLERLVEEASDPLCVCLHGSFCGASIEKPRQFFTNQHEKMFCGLESSYGEPRNKHVQFIRFAFWKTPVDLTEVLAEAKRKHPEEVEHQRNLPNQNKRMPSKIFLNQTEKHAQDNAVG